MDYILTFLEGIASFISPCLLPMVPIYISYFAGGKENKTTKTLINSIGFVFGFSIVFIILSIFASTIGSLFGLKIKYIKIFFGIVIIILGLNYLDVFDIKFLNKSKIFSNNKKDINFFRALIFGMLFSVSWTPCVGTFLSSALILIANEQNLLKGLILIVLYSIGLGIPFIISAIFIEKLKLTFNFIKKHYGIIQKICGVILIVMGIYVIFF